jgi:AraC-like DNA-binding protein
VDIVSNGFDESRKSDHDGALTVRPDAFVLLRADLGRLGLDVEPLLALHEPSKELDARSRGAQERPSSLLVASIYAEAVTQSGDELLGLRLGRLRSQEWLGTYGEMIAHAPTLRDAIEQAHRFLAVLVEGQTLTLQERENRSTLTTTLPEVLAPAGRSVILQSTAVVCANVVTHLLQRPLLSLELLITNPKPRSCNAAVAALLDQGWQIHFGAASYGIGFPSAYLELKPLTRRPEEYGRLMEALKQEKAELDSKEDMRRRVRSYLLLNLAQQPQVAEVARAIGSSPRKLQLDLAKQNSSFQEELAQCRLLVARQFLRITEESIGFIAAAVGFQSTAAFSRFFRGRAGRSPLSFRRDDRSSG